MHFDGLIDRKLTKKSILISSTYNLYQNVQPENAASIPKFLNEKYNTIQYNKNYKEWILYQSRIEEI
jgi:hypothetical protein